MKNVLLVGCNFTDHEIPNVRIETLGLCRPGVCEAKAAYALYEYDVIIINPESYSHFIFGEATVHSESINELWNLKAENNQYDLDSVFDSTERSKELRAAIKQGTHVIWLLAAEKRTKFFGTRTVFSGYVNSRVVDLVQSSTIHQKKSRRLVLNEDSREFDPYFDQLRIDGWKLCMSDFEGDLEVFAETPEGHCIGGKITIGSSTGWLLTPPTSEDATNLLIRCACALATKEFSVAKYHGIFLSHNSEDKPFVRELKKDLMKHGVKDVWLDEAEILVGDSLIKKIDEGLKKTKYFGIVLSPKSIKSPWVDRELEIAINREIATGEVVVLPLLYEKCDLPSFLVGKMYADFTSSKSYEESLEKLLRRLRVK